MKKMFFLKQCVKPFLTMIIKFFWLFPIKKNKVLFSAFSARVYGDNPKYIAEKLLEVTTSVECVFVLRQLPKESLIIPSEIKIVKYNTFRYLFELATAKVWVDNTRKQDFVVKRRGQIYIQTWHGALPLKKIERDIESHLNKRYVRAAKRDSKMMNYLLTSSQYGKELFRNCFWYDGLIKVTGSPRLDKLIGNKNGLCKSTMDELGLRPDINYVLYAPTFRDNGDTDVYNLDFDKIVAFLSKKFKGTWKVILKLHPNIRDEHINGGSNVINASLYPDIVDLFSVSKVLITDYSSSMFDFALTKKPVFLLTFDLNSFLKVRKLYFNIRDLPFPVSMNMKEFQDNIISFNNKDYESELGVFFNKLNILEDGEASERIVSIIQKSLNY